MGSAEKMVVLGGERGEARGASWVALHEMRPGRCGVVARVEAEGDLADQLKCMGVCSGRKVEVVKQGDPLILKVLATRIGVSARLAERVYVDVCSGDECVT